MHSCNQELKKYFTFLMSFLTLKNETVVWNEFYKTKIPEMVYIRLIIKRIEDQNVLKLFCDSKIISL